MSDKDVEAIVGPLSTSEDGSFKFKKFVSLYESLYQDIRLRREQSPMYAVESSLQRTPQYQQIMERWGMKRRSAKIRVRYTLKITQRQTEWWILTKTL